MSSAEAAKPTLFHRAVVVSALGYFVDIYDLILFSVVRKKSLLDIGVPEERILESGILLINLQMIGMLVGGVIWGVLGDKRGRISVLYGSILLYSLANLANAFVHDELTYGVLRFIAGVGLAGELGAAITLVSEVLGKELRSAAAGVVAGFGLLGSIAAALVGEALSWRFAYALGGVLGLLLLLLRMKTGESEIFAKIAASKPSVRGTFLAFFTNKDRLSRYLSCIGLGVPVWLVVGVFATLAPDLAQARGIEFPVKASTAVMLVYIGLALGDLGSGILSHAVASRKKVIAAFMASAALLSVAHLTFAAAHSFVFHASFVLLGIAIGYWALFVLTTAETFGTNLRATATTTVPNFVRGSVVPMNFIVAYFAADGRIVTGAWWATFAAFLCSFLAVWALKETHGRDLDFNEELEKSH
ncbi:MAG: MFS transporter [Betaproteobacteria bacterium]|nr:MFS transporter [Betaproteobacteria bacterium]